MTPTRPSFGTSVMQDSLRLLDAHLIFEPILTCLGVMPQQMVNNITNAGKLTPTRGAVLNPKLSMILMFRIFLFCVFILQICHHWTVWVRTYH